DLVFAMPRNVHVRVTGDGDQRRLTAWRDVYQHDRVRTLAACATCPEPPLLRLAHPSAGVRTHQQECLARLISGPLTGWRGIDAGDLRPRVCRYADQPQDEQEEQDQQHPEELPNWMSLLCGPCRLRRHRPAWSTGSARRAGRWGFWARRRGPVAGGARRAVGRLARPRVWCGSPVWIRH